MSRLQLANTAVRPKMFARMMLSGPPGSGKTKTALQIAKELVHGDLSKITVMDTEKDSALTYADEYPGFEHLPWDPPYAPGELGKTVIEAGARPQTEVVIVDSLTHFWRKEGGVMSIADGKFGGWKAARPAQEQMVDALLGAQCHVIVCVRSKVEYAQMEDENRRGKQKVVKMGMSPQQDGDLEYEMNIAAEIDMEHAIAISKSRTTEIPVNRTYAPGAAAELGAAYADWLTGGVEIETLSREALQTRLGTLSQPVAQRVAMLWQERNLPPLQELNPPQILRVVGLIDQAQADLGELEPTPAPGDWRQQPQAGPPQGQQQPQGPPPGQAPQQQRPAPQNPTQPPQQYQPQQQYQQPPAQQSDAQREAQRQQAERALYTDRAAVLDNGDVPEPNEYYS